MKYTAAALLISSLFSCSSKPLPGVTEKAVTQLNAATKATEQANLTLFRDFDNKLHDPQTAAQAQIWLPPALHAKEISDSLLNYLDSWDADFKKLISDSLNFTKKLSDVVNSEQKILLQSLEDKLKPYPDNLYAINPKISGQFANLPQEPAMFSPFSKNATLGELYLQLAIQKNIIRQNENKVVTFCSYQFGGCILTFEQFSAIVGQSSNILKPGDKLTLSAGVGAFSTNSKPQFIMNGKSISPDANGVGTYEMQVPQKPGKYHVPVSIKFTKPDGTEYTKDYTLKYEVAKRVE
jgi:hypothetical protein